MGAAAAGGRSAPSEAAWVARQVLARLGFSLWR
jgi:hypothetical protein